MLGFSTFSIVRMCLERATGINRAVKVLARRLVQIETKSENLNTHLDKTGRDDIENLLQVRHPNLIRIWDYYETDDAIFLVMDLCASGMLFEKIAENDSLNEYDVQCIMHQVLSGVEHIHSKGIMNLNLKPENLLMSNRNDIHNGIVISDFGLEKIMVGNGLLFLACCSLQHLAPEILLGQEYDGKVDVWSCGVIAYSLLCGYTPFYCDNVMRKFQDIVEMNYEFHPQFWQMQSALAKDFIERCLCDKSVRMTVNEALHHPWITRSLQTSLEEEKGPNLSRNIRNEAPASASRKDSLSAQLEDLLVLQQLRKRYRSASDHEIDMLDQFVERFKSKLDKVENTVPLKDPKDETRCSRDEVLDKKGFNGCSETEPTSKKVKESTRHFIRGTQNETRQEPHTTSTVQVLDKLLEQYRTAKLPAYSRVDPKAEIQPKEQITFSKIIRSVPALLNRSYSLGSAIVSHLLYGPPKKSWGVEMSILTRMIREVAEENTDLASIEGLQKIFELVQFLPIPEDGLITPVTFRVKRRNLRGFLCDFDAEETGKRELTGEWIVGKQTWRRLQQEWQKGIRSRSERVILYIHGGAYYLMSASTHRPLTIAISKYCECRVFCVNYRLAPETIFPGALLDVAYSYFRLTDDLHIPPNNIVIAADSAGGGLAVALLMYLRDNKYPLPCGTILMSPWVDLTLSCDSWETNKEFDYLPRPWRGNHMNPINAYLGPNMDKYLMHPYVSPLFGEMENLPPMLVQTGDAERLRDEAVLFCHKCSLAGVPIRHEIYEDCVHVFQFFLFLEASKKAFKSMRHFMRTVLNKRQGHKASVVDESACGQLDEEMIGTDEPAEPGSPTSHQRPAEQLDPDGVKFQTLEGFGPEGDEDLETWDLDGDEDARDSQDLEVQQVQKEAQSTEISKPVKSLKMHTDLR